MLQTDGGKQLFDAVLKAKIAEALSDKRPDVAADEVEARLLARHQSRLKRST